MEIGEKLKELNLSSEEMGRITNAFKDGKFREMLREYVQDMSDPENMRKYEEEIQQWEQERGNTVEFIQPSPFRVIRISNAAKQKCFINICANDKIHTPQAKSAVSEDGRRGQCWSLPHSLQPGRTDRDTKGNTYVIYDVIFHPDTLHMASKNKAFMEMVYDAAIDGVQRAFKVHLDKNKVKEMKTKYKGTPQPCVIRRPIPGFNPQNSTPEDLALTDNRAAQNQSFQFQSQKNQDPVKPNYTVKYRSMVDLQDFRCSRDSVQSPRPKEILITIDLPLLTSVRDTNLEVKEKSLLLESKQPAYKLYLPLAYPVDEDQGEAKFNKHTGKLSVTLPVRPPDDALRHHDGLKKDSESQAEQSEVEEEQTEQEVYEKNKEEVKSYEQAERNQEKGLVKNCDEEQKSGGNDQQIKREQHETEEEKTGTELPKQESLQVSNEEEAGPKTIQETKSQSTEERSAVAKDQIEDEPVRKTGVHAPETVAVKIASTFTENQEVLISDKQTIDSEDNKEVRPSTSLESTSNITSFDDREGTGKDEQGASLQLLPSFGEPQISPEVSFPPTESSVGEACLSGRSVESSQAFITAAVEKGKETDEDDLPAPPAAQTSEKNNDPPAAVMLREIDADGKETLINDHSTSAGFIFQNKIMYELD
ncbi:protein kintoun [Cyprinodon tularosa]|uniref:protein kintoun n=1 Tax=Cyprinodon tularosa TaxID=77115 RepID=UPI0018E24802|nr:protein kintoun [Cyprinodon tularosa]